LFHKVPHDFSKVSKGLEAFRCRLEAMIQRLLIVFALCVMIADAQVTTSSVTVTASRTTNLQPDQVVYGVTLTTPVSGTRDDALNALGGSGITLANLTRVYSTTIYPSGSYTNPQDVLQWNFSLTVSLSDMKNTNALLSSIASSLAKKNNGQSISISVQGTQVSTALQQSQPCPVADLISDARAQAQTLASPASMTVGAILAMSSPTPAGSPCTLTVKFAAFPY
jgi:hypothetical protein